MFGQENVAFAFQFEVPSIIAELKRHSVVVGERDSPKVATFVVVNPRRVAVEIMRFLAKEGGILVPDNKVAIPSLRFTGLYSLGLLTEHRLYQTRMGEMLQRRGIGGYEIVCQSEVFPADPVELDRICKQMIELNQTGPASRLVWDLELGGQVLTPWKTREYADEERSGY